MADLRNLSKIYNTLAEACQKTFEPSENQAQVHAQHQTFVQAKRDLTRASNGASSQAKEITEMIAAAEAEGATIGTASIKMHHSLATSRLEELTLRFTYLSAMAAGHIVVSKFPIIEEGKAGYTDSQAYKIEQSVESYRKTADDARNALMRAMSRLNVPEPPAAQLAPAENRPKQPKSNKELDPGKFTGSTASEWKEYFDKYKRWFQASNFMHASNDEMYGYLQMRLPEALFERCVQIKSPETHFSPLTRDHSIFLIVEESLGTTDPIRNRRQAWYDLQPQSGEEFIDFHVRLVKAEEVSKMEMASNEDILVMKRMTSLSTYPELKKEILKIPVTANNPLTRDLIWKKVVEFTRIQAELKNTEHTANLVKGPAKSSRCLSCNAAKPDNLKLCSNCFKNGPRKGTYCPKCKSSDNHTQEACSGQNFKWPQASPWMKAQNRNRTPSRSPNRNSGRNSPRNQRGRSPQRKPPPRGRKGSKTRFSHRAAAAVDQPNDPDSSEPADTWHPDSPVSTDNEAEICNMARLVTGNNSDPDSDPDLPSGAQSDPGPGPSHQNDSSDSSDDEDIPWFHVATATYRLGQPPHDYIVAQPDVARWRRHRRPPHLPSSSSDDSSDEDDDGPPYPTCLRNSCPGTRSCTPNHCEFDGPAQAPLGLLNPHYDPSDSSFDVGLGNDLFCSTDNNSEESPEVSDNDDQESVNIMTHKVSYSATDKIDTLPINIKADNDVGDYYKAVACPDTGATTSLMATKLAKKLKLQISPFTGKLIIADGSNMTVAGQAHAMVNYGRSTVRVKFLIADEVCDRILIGLPTLKELSIIHRSFPCQLPEFPISDAHSVSSAKLNIDKLPDPLTVVYTRLKKFQEEDAVNAAKAISNLRMNQPTDHDFQKFIDHLKIKFPDNFISGAPTSRIIGKPATITLKKDAVFPPLQACPRNIPLNYVDQCIATFRGYVEAGIVERLGDQKVDIYSPTFFIIKPSGKGMRLITDFSILNSLIHRSPIPFPSPKDILERVPGDSQFHLACDLADGYFQQPLSRQSSLLTAFTLTPQMKQYSGSWIYRCNPQGLCTSGDSFNLITDHYLNCNGAIEGLQKVIDDVLISAPTWQQLKDRAYQLMHCLKMGNIKISHKKLQVGRRVKYVGYDIDANRISADMSKVKPLLSIPPPKSLKECKGFLGAINQMSIFIPHLSPILKPVMDLTRKNVAYIWAEPQQQAFDLAIKKLADMTGIVAFDVNKPAILITDTSRLQGCAASLHQREKDGSLTLVGCHSRVLKTHEANWSVSELEYLALIYGLQRFRFYLLGLPHFEHETDHSALVQLTKMPIDKLPTKRLMGLRLMSTDFSFTTRYVKGKSKTHWLADCLSRNPANDPDDEEIINLCHSNALLSLHNDTIDPKIIKLQEDAQACPEYKQLTSFFRSFTPVADLPSDHPARQFSSQTLHDMSLEQGLLLVRDKILVPRPSRSYILEILHRAHTGKDALLQNARAHYFWPHLTKEVEDITRSCLECLQSAPTQPDQPLNTILGKAPGEILGIDPFTIPHCNKVFLIIVDSFSSFFWLEEMRNSTLASIIAAMENHFRYTNLRPLKIISDAGVYFQSPEWSAYCQKHGIVAQVNSPLNSKANGLAEANIRLVKRLLILHKGQTKSEGFTLAQACLRNTAPTKTRLSRHTLLYGYPPRGELPLLPHSFDSVDRSEAVSRKIALRDSQKLSHDKKAKPLSRLRKNQRVLIQDLKKGPHHKRFHQKGRILRESSTPDSYHIILDNGGCIKRNRSFLRLIHTRGKIVRFSAPVLSD